MRVHICACFSRISNIFFSVIVATGCVEIIQENTASDSSTPSNLESDNHAEAAAQEKQNEDNGGQAAANEDIFSLDAGIHENDKDAVVESVADQPDPLLSKGDIGAEAADGEPSQNGVCLSKADASKEESLPSKANTGIDCNVEAPESAE